MKKEQNSEESTKATDGKVMLADSALMQELLQEQAAAHKMYEWAKKNAHPQSLMRYEGVALGADLMIKVAKKHFC